MRENKYQADLIKRIKERFPGCQVLKNDPGHQQGMLDLTILYGEWWAALEVKASANAQHQPNQDYYVHHLGSMGFASFIYPENEEEVLDALQDAFSSRRQSRVS